MPLKILDLIYHFVLLINSVRNILCVMERFSSLIEEKVMSLVSDDIKIKIKMYTQFVTGFLEANLNAINNNNVI